MSKGKSAIDDHRITITSWLHGLGRKYAWHCGCGAMGRADTNPQATFEGYAHVKRTLQQ